jgi:general secretion pathway protein L
MNEWLKPFQERGLKPDAIIPETLCLPAAEPERWSALAEPQQVTVRTGAYSGFACGPDDLGLFLQMADPDKKALVRVVVARDFGADLTQLGWPVELLPGFSAPLEAMLQSLHLDRVIDLQQGPYSQRESMARAWRPWRVSAALLAAWILLAGAWHGVAAFKLQRELTALDAQNVQRYTELFPADSRIVDLAAQLGEQLKQLRGGGGHGGMLPLVQSLGGALAAVPGLTIQSLQFRDGTLSADLKATNLQLLDQLAAWYGGQKGVRMERLAANSTSEGVQLRIRLSPA